MKFHEKSHYSQKYIFSDALEEDYRLQLRAVLRALEKRETSTCSATLTRQLRLGSKRNQYDRVTKAETCAFLMSATWHYYRL